MRLSLDNFRASAANTLLSKEQQRHTRGGESTYDVDYGITCSFTLYDTGGHTIITVSGSCGSSSMSDCQLWNHNAASAMMSSIGGGGTIFSGCN